MEEAARQETLKTNIAVTPPVRFVAGGGKRLRAFKLYPPPQLPHQPSS